MDEETRVAVAKMGVAAGGVLFYGLTLNEWMAVITIIYVLMQIGLLIPKYWGAIKRYFFGEDECSRKD